MAHHYQDFSCLMTFLQMKKKLKTRLKKKKEEELKNQMFEYDKIAIGCNLSSAIYCFYNQIPMIFVEKRKVHPFDFLNQTQI